MKDQKRQTANHWAIVLAGGEGQRMRPFIQSWLGYPKPKQYCAFVGTRSMLQHTWDRADQVGHSENKVTIIDKSHEKEIVRQLEANTKGYILSQPRNCDTAPGIFLALTYITHWNPQAIVTIYPSDHFIAPRELFTRMIQGTVSAVTRLKDQIILLGATPNSFQGEYGWICPGRTLPGNFGFPVRTVENFIEKPNQQMIQTLSLNGGIWNTMIVTAYGGRLWRLGEQWCPGMMELFHQLKRAIGTSQEIMTLERIYRNMPHGNFSKNFLERIVTHLASIEIQGILWSDWGRPERIIETLGRLRKQPAFPFPQLAS
ncbi:MAG: sugar phosphate nucleotidyltransferase [Nitrospirales bacterium]